MSDSDDRYKGYRGPCIELMKQHDVTVWSEIKARTTRGDFEGLLLPRSETSDAEHLVLKLISGYNVGLRHDTILSMEKVGYREAHYKMGRRQVAGWGLLVTGWELPQLEQEDVPCVW